MLGELAEFLVVPRIEGKTKYLMQDRTLACMRESEYYSQVVTCPYYLSRSVCQKTNSPATQVKLLRVLYGVHHIREIESNFLGGNINDRMKTTDSRMILRTLSAIFPRQVFSRKYFTWAIENKSHRHNQAVL